MYVYPSVCLLGLNPFLALKTVSKTGKKKTRNPLIFKGFRAMVVATGLEEKIGLFF